MAHGLVSGLIANAGTGGSGSDAIASLGFSAISGGIEGYSNGTAFREGQASLREDHNMRLAYPESYFLPAVHIEVMRNGGPYWWGSHSFANPVANAVRAGTSAMAPFAMAIIPIPGIPGLGGLIGKGVGRFAAKGGSVIGPRSTYREFAKKIDANFLDVTDEAWTMRNVEFLQGVVKRGDDVIFSGKYNPDLLNAKSVLGQEIRYLQKHGYSWSDDFTRLIKK